MRVTYITRSFLDYRVPVFAALDELTGGNLYVVFSKDYVPDRVSSKVSQALGVRAIGLSGEWQLGGHDNNSWANCSVAFRLHPGLLRTIRSCEPDVLIGDGFFKWTLASVFYKGIHRTPLVICYERTSHTERDAQWYRTLYRRAILKITDAMCCNGRLCGEYVQSLGFPASRITYGHMAADVQALRESVSSLRKADKSQIITKLGLKGVVFSYVGSLVIRKGLCELLRAWKEFTSGISRSETTLLIIGDGPQRAELQQYCNKVGLSNVYFTGLVDYDDIALYYGISDVLVMPTLEDNWSLVVPEATSCGLPVLCSKYNGCWPELVKPENGWVFDPLDPRDFAEKLTRCVDSKDRFGRLGKCSREIVERFTPDKAAKSILTACEMALS